MAWCLEHVQRHAFDRELVALGEPHRYHVDLAAFAHHGDAMGAIAQRAQAGDVVGMQVGIDRLDQLEVELADELDVTIDLLQHRIDDQRLAAAPAGDEVGVSARDVVEELAEDHRCDSPIRGMANPFGRGHAQYNSSMATQKGAAIPLYSRNRAVNACFDSSIRL